MIHGRKNIKFI